MFASLEPAPPDPILGIGVAFNADPRGDKVNLSIGVFKDENGQTPVLACVQAAEERMLRAIKTKNYLPIGGCPKLIGHARRLMLGDGHPLLAGDLLTGAQTPGGTGALRVMADFLAATRPDMTVWMSDPTWANHQGIFQSAGLKVATHPYFDAATNSLRYQEMLACLRNIPAGDAILLHGCCHNPTGVDLSTGQWQALAEVLGERSILPLIDLAYQGFGDGLDEDVAGVRIMMQAIDELFVASSYSKNFGLYAERTGALTFKGQTQASATAVFSHLCRVSRTNFSTPSAHGGHIVTTILDDAQLTAQWQAELAAMRQRIHAARNQFADALDQRGVSLSGDGNDFIRHQRGMFSFSGLKKPHVDRLRDDFGIYIVGSGRINVAGLTSVNIPTVCDAIAKVL